MLQVAERTSGRPACLGSQGEIFVMVGVIVVEKVPMWLSKRLSLSMYPSFALGMPFLVA
jgi:hypothetical protein